MSDFINPVQNARITSPFGYRILNGKREFHQGVDLASPTPGAKVPIYASAAGTVVYAGSLSTYGKSVRILHNIKGKTYETNYAHLDKINVKLGQVVKQGEQIGIMGNTGGSFGVHLHFEVHNGRYAPGQPNAVDPMKYISKKDNDYKKKIGYNIPKDSKAFRLHTAPYKNKAEADKAAKELVKDGHLRYAETFGNDKDGYRIQSGKYTSLVAAEEAAKKMIDDKTNGYISVVGNKK